jgi:NAD+ synthase/NAD+ synthase (glutamine-hydrolysing)
MPTLTIALAQINPTIGDIDGNLALIVAAARRAHAAGAQLVAFPELSLTAYYPADLLEDPDFQRRLAKGVAALIATSKELPDLHWVVGAPTPNTGIGKPLFNSLLVVKNGEVLLQYHKQLLPTYNIFDERRHFEPGPDVAKILDIEDVRVGFMICEDGWNDEERDYVVNPFKRLADAAPDLVVSINASPSSIGRREMRHDIFSKASARHGLPLVYVNQIGGHDQVIYDGASFAVDPARGVVMEGARFQPDLMVLQVHSRAKFLDREGRPLGAINVKGLSTNEFYREQLVLGLRDYARRCGFSTAVVGCSGGIDSALTLAIAVEALGAKNVVAITMPSHYSSTGSVTDSQRLCQNLGIELYTHPIGDLVEQYAGQFGTVFGEPLVGLSKENLQARIRGTILMEFSNRFGHLLLTTGNKSEISVGYCTLYGDTNGGLGVIGDLYKTEVFGLSRYYNEVAGREIIPTAIIDKPPSAELAPGQKDTDSLPPYEVLDPILKTLIEGSRLSQKEGEEAMKFVRETSKTDAGKALIERVKKMIARNEYKRRQAPPILRVRSRAFGSGRQMPIAAKY